jgi:hypothetical protein
LEFVSSSSCFTGCAGDFGEIVLFAVVGFGSFGEDELVVTLGVGSDELQRKNKTVFAGIVG